ncbi:Thioredoxin domain-containing protein 17 [Rhizoclosmatium sp. JEL0117]|nr:Thioredoxin domain-containing protein 17 [Rhizoclosmatium sp. JEL0117]
MTIVHRVHNFYQFDLTLATSLADARGRVFVMTFGSEDPETGESWCPDSRAGMPLIRKAIEKVSNATLLECPTGDRAEWKDLNNPYRHHKLLKASRIPTIYEISHDGKRVLQQLVEKEVTEDNLNKFIENNGDSVGVWRFGVGYQGWTLAFVLTVVFAAFFFTTTRY